MTGYFFKIFLLISFSVSALGLEKKAYEKGKWKTFTSDYGFTFKYPDCWVINVGTPDDGPTLEKTNGILASEGPSCKTPRMDRQAPNGMVFSTLIRQDKSVITYEDEKKKEERLAETRKYLISNITKIRGHFTHLYVEKLESRQGIYAIRWKMEVTCHDYKIFIGGPSIGDPDESYFKKFKAGDMALPEPYKSIYDSVRCTEYKMPQPPAEEATPEVEPEPKKRAKPAKRAKEPQKYNIIKLLEDPLKKMEKK